MTGMTFKKGGALGYDVPVSPDDPLPITSGAGSAGVPTVPQAAATGGVPSNFRIASSGATNNAFNIKASVGSVYFVIAYNTSTTVAYLKLYNKTTTPSPAVDTPVVSLPIPPGGGIALDLGLAMSLFPNGLGMAIVKGAADNDNTAVAAGDITGINVGYA
jgi:hypothetical protein